MMEALIVDRGDGPELHIRREVGDMYIPIDQEAIERLMYSCRASLKALQSPSQEWR